MAITNAQQYKQLVNPPLDGKRPGYRGDAAARSTGAAQSGRVDPETMSDPEKVGLVKLEVYQETQVDMHHQHEPVSEGTN